MIRGDPATAAIRSAHGPNRITVEEVFRRHAQRRPDALALADAANRETFNDGAPRRLTYAEADRMVTAIAGRLRLMGLPTDAIVGIQLPNIVENILVTLGVLRAGMIAASLPLLSRRTDAVAALARIGAKALFTCSRVGTFNHGQHATAVAADVFSIRYVCGFGNNLPDGVVSFDDSQSSRRTANATAHVAAVTFDITEGGLVPVARNHAELLAGGFAVLLESRLAQDATILSTVAVFIHRHLPDAFAMAPVRRHAPAAPPVRRGDFGRSSAGETMRRACPARPGGFPSRCNQRVRDRRAVVHYCGVAIAGPARGQSSVA
jgi:hypothetical protein